MSHATLCFLSYNRPVFLERAVTTALEAIDEPAEVIVHDDGSTDPALLKLLYTWHQQGRVSSLILNAPGVNQGQGIGLNRMFRMATGDPIIKLDHDLVFKPGWLARAKQILSDERVGLVGLFKYWHPPVDWRMTQTGEQPQAYHSYHTHICGSGMVIPRRVWEELGPFEERLESFGEDWLFQQKVHNSGLHNALPDDDLVENVGFGVGPSTVVVQGENGPEPAKIHKLPMLVGPGVKQ